MAALTSFDTGVNAGLMTSSWPMWGHDPAHSSHTDYAGPDSPILLWTFNPGTGWMRGTPSVDAAGNVYVGTNSGLVYKVNPNGQQVWSRQLGNTIWSSSPALGDNGDLYVGCGSPSPGWIESLTQAAGTINWSYLLVNQGVAYSSPTIGSNGVIYIGNEDNPGVTAALCPTGQLYWSYVTGHEDSSPCLDPAGNTYSTGISTTTTGTSALYAMSPTGSILWTYLLPTWSQCSPMYLGGVVYTGTLSGGQIMAFNSSNGSLAWSYQTANQLCESAPSYDGAGRVYMAAMDGNVYCLSQAGSLIWSYTLASSSRSNVVSDSRGRLYVVDFSGNFYILNSNGTLHWSYSSGVWTGGSDSIAIGPDGTMYVPTMAGILYAFGDVPAPSFTPTPVVSWTPTPFVPPPCPWSPSATSTPALTPTSSSSVTSTVSPTETASGTATLTSTETATVNPSFSRTKTGTPTPTSTITATTSSTETPTASPPCGGLLLDRNLAGVGDRVVISDCVPAGAVVTVRIYNSAGELVRRLAEGIVSPAGWIRWDWNLKNDGGNSVVSGIYVVVFRADQDLALKTVGVVR